MITQMNSKTKGSSKIQELELKMREVDEKSKLSDARIAKMKAENLDLKCRMDKVASELAIKEDLLAKEKEKLSKLTKHIDSYRKKCLALAKK